MKTIGQSRGNTYEGVILPHHQKLEKGTNNVEEQAGKEKKRESKALKHVNVERLEIA